MIAPITGMDLLLEPANVEDIDLPGTIAYRDAGDDDMSVDEWMGEISNMSDSECLSFWHRQKEFIFAHREEPIPVFKTGVVEKSGYEFQVARKQPYGRYDRPVLERSERFTQLGKEIGKVISLQYMVDSRQSIAEASKQIPYDVSDTDLDTIQRFFDANDAAWVLSGDGPGFAGRFPISESTSYSGMIYFMYSLNETGQEIPRYIGMSRKLGRDDRSLGSNFANITRDSVFGRWGYGESQHLGELSRAIFPESYNREPEPKYEDWVDALFYNRTRLLKSPVYIEMVPFFDESIKDAEEKLIRLASRVFSPSLLNKEYTSK